MLRGGEEPRVVVAGLWGRNGKGGGGDPGRLGHAGVPVLETRRGGRRVQQVSGTLALRQVRPRFMKSWMCRSPAADEVTQTPGVSACDVTDLSRDVIAGASPPTRAGRERRPEGATGKKESEDYYT